MGPLPALLLLVARNKIKNVMSVLADLSLETTLVVCGPAHLVQTQLIPPRADVDTRGRGPPLAAAKDSTNVHAPLERDKLSPTVFKVKADVGGALHCTPRDLGRRWRAGHSTSELIRISSDQVSSDLLPHLPLETGCSTEGSIILEQ